jgi:hypothetical protein
MGEPTREDRDYASQLFDEAWSQYIDDLQSQEISDALAWTEDMTWNNTTGNSFQELSNGDVLRPESSISEMNLDPVVIAEIDAHLRQELESSVAHGFNNLATLDQQINQHELFGNSAAHCASENDVVFPLQLPYELQPPEHARSGEVLQYRTPNLQTPSGGSTVAGGTRDIHYSRPVQSYGPVSIAPWPPISSTSSSEFPVTTNVALATETPVQRSELRTSKAQGPIRRKKPKPRSYPGVPEGLCHVHRINKTPGHAQDSIKAIKAIKTAKRTPRSCLRCTLLKIRVSAAAFRFSSPERRQLREFDSVPERSPALLARR